MHNLSFLPVLLSAGIIPGIPIPPHAFMILRLIIRPIRYAGRGCFYRSNPCHIKRKFPSARIRYRCRYVRILRILRQVGIPCLCRLKKHVICRIEIVSSRRPRIHLGGICRRIKQYFIYDLKVLIISSSVLPCTSHIYTRIGNHSLTVNAVNNILDRSCFSRSERYCMLKDRIRTVKKFRILRLIKQCTHFKCIILFLQLIPANLISFIFYAIVAGPTDADPILHIGAYVKNTSVRTGRIMIATR